MYPPSPDPNGRWHLEPPRPPLLTPKKKKICHHFAHFYRIYATQRAVDQANWHIAWNCWVGGWRERWPCWLTDGWMTARLKNMHSIPGFILCVSVFHFSLHHSLVHSSCFLGSSAQCIHFHACSWNFALLFLFNLWLYWTGVGMLVVNPWILRLNMRDVLICVVWRELNELTIG